MSRNIADLVPALAELARLEPLRQAAETYALARNAALAAIAAEYAAGAMPRTDGRWVAMQEAANARTAACISCDRAAEALFLAALLVAATSELEAVQ